MVLGMGESKWKSSSARGIASCSTFGRDVSGVSPMLCGGKDYAVGTACPPHEGVLVVCLVQGGLPAWWGRCESWAEGAYGFSVVMTNCFVGF